MLTTKMEKLTPELAEQFLASSRLNRSINDDTVTLYARQMTRGQWQSWPPLGFADGHMVDGHHRCRAAIESGSPVSIYVVRGLSGEVQKILDTGQKRRLVDLLKMYHPEVDNRATRASYLGMCCTLLVGRHVPIRNLHDYHRLWGIFAPGLEWSMSLSADRAIRPASVAGSLAFAHRRDPGKVEKFGDRMASRAALGAHSPEHILLRSLGNTVSVGGAGGRWILALRVLNAAMTGMLGGTIERVSSGVAGLEFFREAYGESKTASALLKDWGDGPNGAGG